MGKVATRYRAVVAFDGRDYSGYQLQSNGITVQQRLEEALSYLDRRQVRVYGSSRTDAGVHAKGFCCHFDLEKPIPQASLVRAMNARLPEDIRVLKAVRTRPDFDARLDAVWKEYRYFLYNGAIMPPHVAPYSAFQHRPLDIDAMRKAAGFFTGRHDFVSFAANPHRELQSTVRNIFSFAVKRAGARVVFIVRGDGFLYRQVRSMVGFLVRVGLGDEKPEAVKELLDGHPPRTARVPTAPAKGLFLWKVCYSGTGNGRKTEAG